MTLTNKTRNSILATRLRVADTAKLRMKGLLGENYLPDGEGLQITPCSSVHMFFMRFAIDVIFLDQKNRVVGLCRQLKPYHLSPLFFNSCCAIELPAGKIDQTQTQQGDELTIT